MRGNGEIKKRGRESGRRMTDDGIRVLGFACGAPARILRPVLALSRGRVAVLGSRAKGFLDILLALKGRGFLPQDGDVPPRGCCEPH